MFKPVDNNVHFPAQEERVLAFWKERGTYEKSLEARRGGPPFVFYEGPPTANGLPHPGHCLTRAIKDLFPRYRTMRGYFCERKAGWDTHGLPVEVEVCKELGIHSKEEIESFGIEPFIHKCQQSVWRYMKEWERLTERLGFWIKLSDAYVTYHQSYIESVWWSLKNLFERGLLYRGHKILWWWAQGGTALSSGEVGQGYRETDDPSLFVRLPLLDAAGKKDGTSLLVWTTTPWTLPSNQFAAINPTLEYAVFEDPELPPDENRLIISTGADAWRGYLQKKKDAGKGLRLIKDIDPGSLIGRRYVPPFGYFHESLGDLVGKLRTGGEQHVYWRIVAADFVTNDSGSGAVHEAPAFGEVDFALLLKERARFVDGEGPELFCPVTPNGRFTNDITDFAGQWVKDADRSIIRLLSKRGLVHHETQVRHEYPFCWRAEEDPLIQYPRETWFIRTTQFRDAMIDNNQKINWLPEHIRDGRFGNFLQSNVDWALSRERYWGTPLPIWVCDKTGKMEAVASYAELLAKPQIRGTEVWDQAKQSFPDLAEDLKVHKPYIDHITYESPFQAGSRMRRVSEVIDCWYDSGAMPFAQWGYPHQNRDRFERQFPADFISEAIDQTRGWFYSLLAISTLAFPEKPFPHPFENCIVLGLMLAEWWEAKDKRIFLTEEEAAAAVGANNAAKKVGKMSKQIRNYRSPQEIFEQHGADALRWYFFANQPPWTSVVYSERTIKESIPEFLLRLWNVYSFFVVYGNIDGFDPASQISGTVKDLDRESLTRGKTYRPIAEREELDRWILSELDQTVAAVIEKMDGYDNFSACERITAFVDALSNWYVRRSRERFWSNDPHDRDKLDAYWTLYECLITASKMIAPFVPFVAETLWQNLAGIFGDRATESVHWCDYPLPNAQAVDAPLLRRMGLLREIASLGRSARGESKLKVRQPLQSVTAILNDQSDRPWLEEHEKLLRSELNVLRVDYAADAAEFVTYKIQPNFKLVGPKVGALMPKVKEALGKADGGRLLSEMNQTGKVTLAIADANVELNRDEIQIFLQAKPGRAAAQGGRCVVVLDTELTPELLRQGMANDIIRLVQDLRKERNLQYTDRIHLSLVTADPELNKAIQESRDRIQAETLAEVLDDKPQNGQADNCNVAGNELAIYFSVVA